MDAFMASHRLRPLALAILLAVSLGACSTWSRRPLPAPGGDNFFPIARVTRADGVPILLDNVTVSRDSVVGRARNESHARVAIPVSAVRMVEARRADAIGTAAVVMVTIIGTIALWGAYELRNLGTDY
jgi:hypothetical protein